MNMRSAIKRSCDVYFYEIARKLGVDRLSETAKKFGLGKKVLKDFSEEKSGVVPNTTWKKNYWSKLVFRRNTYTLVLVKVIFKVLQFNYV